MELNLFISATWYYPVSLEASLLLCTRETELAIGSQKVSMLRSIEDQQATEDFQNVDREKGAWGHHVHIIHNQPGRVDVYVGSSAMYIIYQKLVTHAGPLSKWVLSGMSID